MMLRVPTTVKRGTRRNLQVFECCAPLGQQAVPKRTRLDLSCKELPRWTRTRIIFVLLVAKDMKLNFSDTILWRSWLHPGRVSAAWLAQWKTTLKVVISFLLHFESFLISCFGDVLSTSDWSGLQAPWLEPGVFYVGKLHTPFPQNSTTCLRPDEECSEKKNIWCLRAQGVGWHEVFQRKWSEKCDSLKLKPSEKHLSLKCYC